MVRGFPVFISISLMELCCCIGVSVHAIFVWSLLMAYLSPVISDTMLSISRDVRSMAEIASACLK